MGSDFVTVFRGYDPIQTEMLGRLLVDAGIAAAVTGTRHGALVGVAQNILELSIQVPRHQAAQAADFLEGYFEGDGEELLRQQFGDDEADDDAPRPRPAERKSPLFAAGSVIFLFGGSQLYCRRYLSAALLAGAQLWAVGHMVGDSWASLMTGVVAFAMVLILDVLSGQWAVRQNRRTLRVPAWRELVLGLSMAALAIAVGSMLGPKIPEPTDDSGASCYAPLRHPVSRGGQAR